MRRAPWLASAWAILRTMTDRPGQASPSTVATTEPDPALELPPAVPDDPALERVRALCPYLVADGGDWRTTSAARELRCAAVDPPAAVALEKQRRLCLVDDHQVCATYRAAQRVATDPGRDAAEAERDAIDDDRIAADGAAPPAEGRIDGRPATPARDDSIDGRPTIPPADERPDARWPIPRTTPVVIDRGRVGPAAVRLDRSVAQIGLVGLMVLAFLVLAVARLSSSDRPTQVASPSAAVSPSAVASAALSPSPTPRSSPSIAPSPSPSAAASPAASAGTATYRVKAGDTLLAIAARFGTTVKVLRELNDIPDPSLLRVGQLIRLP
jgi:LysM repeat protein